MGHEHWSKPSTIPLTYGSPPRRHKPAASAVDEVPSAEGHEATQILRPAAFPGSKKNRRLLTVRHKPGQCRVGAMPEVQYDLRSASHVLATVVAVNEFLVVLLAADVAIAVKSVDHPKRLAVTEAKAGNGELQRHKNR